MFSLQGKDASKPTGNWFQLLMILFTKEYRLYRIQHKGKTQEHIVMDVWQKGTVLRLLLLILITVCILFPFALHSLSIVYFQNVPSSVDV